MHLISKLGYLARHPCHPVQSREVSQPTHISHPGPKVFTMYFVPSTSSRMLFYFLCLAALPHDMTQFREVPNSVRNGNDLLSLLHLIIFRDFQGPRLVILRLLILGMFSLQNVLPMTVGSHLFHTHTSSHQSLCKSCSEGIFQIVFMPDVKLDCGSLPLAAPWQLLCSFCQKDLRDPSISCSWTSPCSYHHDYGFFHLLLHMYFEVELAVKKKKSKLPCYSRTISGADVWPGDF